MKSMDRCLLLSFAVLLAWASAQAMEDFDAPEDVPEPLPPVVKPAPKDPPKPSEPPAQPAAPDDAPELVPVTPDDPVMEPEPPVEPEPPISTPVEPVTQPEAPTEPVEPIAPAREVKMTDAPAPTTDTDRLALSAVIDGKMGENEWLPLGDENGVKSYFQWTRDTLYIAAKYSATKSLVISLDCGANGWLKGKDNLEISVPSMLSSLPLRARKLNTSGEAPAYEAARLLEAGIRSAESVEGNDKFIELAIPITPDDGLKWEADKPFAMRIDALDMLQSDRPAFEPRAMNRFKLVYDKLGLPSGVQWDMSYSDRVLSPEDNINFSLDLKNNSTEPFNLQSVKLTGFGAMRDTLNELVFKSSVMYPRDKRNIDYRSQLPLKTPNGTYLLNVEAQTQSGEKLSGMSAFTVTDPIEIELNLPSMRVRPDAKGRIRGEVVFSVSTQKGMSGQFTLTPPSGWTVNGDKRSFNFHRTRMRYRFPIELTVPANTSGVFPIKIEAVLKDRVFSRSFWLEALPLEPADNSKG